MKVSIAIGILGALVLCSQLAMAKPRRDIDENGNPVNTFNGGPAGEGDAAQNAITVFDSQLMTIQALVENYQRYVEESPEDDDDTDMGSVGESVGSMTHGSTGTSASGDNHMELMTRMRDLMDGLVGEYERLLGTNSPGAVRFIRAAFRHSFQPILGQEFTRYDTYFNRLEEEVAGHETESMRFGLTYSFLSIMATEIGADISLSAGPIIRVFFDRISDNTQSVIDNSHQAHSLTECDDIATNAWNELNPDREL